MDQSRTVGLLTGIALGDSLGLPMEGLSATRAPRLYPPPLRQRMAFGWGILSDDTLMAVATIQALFREPDDPDRFAMEVGRRLRNWFWTLPPGIGLATLKSCLKLTVGIPATRSGVASAGNGPAVRAIVLGCCLADDSQRRVGLIEASTCVTHTHPLAVSGSQIVGLAATLAVSGKVDRFDAEAAIVAPTWPRSDRWPSSGPTGYMVHTVNAAIECWRSHPHDMESALRMAVALGGDSDSVAALVGGLVGASPQASSAPQEWLRWMGWPGAREIVEIASGGRTNLPMFRLLTQHALTLALIPSHVLRRALPPYC
ncbi:MAG: ADP-ribosylglycohydrolase family protein [Fimbriimonas sp.]|nr:ADP-ribosylglycohydrolase family protein [Fimbriimonas sp.]